MKRLLIALLTLVVLGSGAWVAATRLESPDQAMARAMPPDPVPVVASLTRGHLAAPISLSAIAAPEHVVAVAAPAALTGVVTAAERSAGEALSSGSALLRVNGRPVFVLSGAFPLFRDIAPGDSGDDVAAVQAALAAVGYTTGRDRAGSYGAGTQAAVRKMYELAGHKAPQVTLTPSVSDSNSPAAAADSTDASSAQVTAPASKGGPVILRTEVVVLGGLPATIQSIAPVGTQLGEGTELVKLGAGAVVLSATVPTESLGTLTVGASAVFVGDTGTPSSATVTAINATPEGDQTVVVVTSDSAVTIDKPYLLTIDNPAGESGESLLAPVAGVVSRGGRSYVYPRDGDLFREVEVTVTGSVGGVAAIAAVDPGVALDESMEIRVG